MSRSQSLRDRDEAGADRCSTANSGTRARLSPLKDSAGSLTRASLIRHFVGRGTEPVGVIGHGGRLGLRRRRDAGSVPGFGHGTRPGQRTGRVRGRRGSGDVLSCGGRGRGVRRRRSARG